MSATDPVQAKRRRIAHWVVRAKQAGYGLYLLATALFAQGYVAGYTKVVTTIIVVCLSAGSLILAPAMVFGYGVKAADREERRAAARAHPQ